MFLFLFLQTVLTENRTFRKLLPGRRFFKISVYVLSDRQGQRLCVYLLCLASVHVQSMVLSDRRMLLLQYIQHTYRQDCAAAAVAAGFG